MFCCVITMGPQLLNAYYEFLEFLLYIRGRNKNWEFTEL